jgi:uncharacterized protein
MPIRAVLDTNVLVSGLVSSQGAPRQLVDDWLADRYVLVSSLYLVQELTRVLTYPRIAEHLHLSQTELDTILIALLVRAEIVPGRIELPGVTRDPKDDAVVACAKEGQADYIVSGDRDLLVLDTVDGTRVVTPQQFVGILAGLEDETSSEESS